GWTPRSGRRTAEGGPGPAGAARTAAPRGARVRTRARSGVLGVRAVGEGREEHLARVAELLEPDFRRVESTRDPALHVVEVVAQRDLVRRRVGLHEDAARGPDPLLLAGLGGGRGLQHLDLLRLRERLERLLEARGRGAVDRAERAQ